MGSQEAPLPLPLSTPYKDRNEVRILVTGFGPFSTCTTNPSYLIAKSLPETLSSLLPGCPPIRLIVHPDPVRVSYRSIRTLIPELLTTPYPQTSDESQPCDNKNKKSDTLTVDFVLHIGLALGRSYYTCEAQAHRDGYTRYRDVDGQLIGSGESGWQELGAPAVLESGFDVVGDRSPSGYGGVYTKWIDGVERTERLNLDLRLSRDPGHYCCDFIYYTSLCEFWRRGMDERVMFLHVPGGVTPRDIDVGRRVAIQLICACVGSWWEEEMRQGTQGVGEDVQIIVRRAKAGDMAAEENQQDQKDDEQYNRREKILMV